MPKLKSFLQDLGLLLYIFTIDQLLNLFRRFGRLVQRFPRTSICSALLGSSALLTWMTFRVASYSPQDSLVLFGLAAAAFVAAIWLAASNRQPTTT